MNLWKSVTPRLLPLHEMPIMWHEEQKQASGKIITNVMSRSSTTRNSFFLTSSVVQGCFHYLKPKEKKSSLCYQIKYQHKNLQEHAATTEDILCSSSLMINRAAEEQKRDTQARVCCCSAHVLPLKEEFSSGQEMLSIFSDFYISNF